MAKDEKVIEVEALCLRDSGFGKAGDVIKLSPKDAATGVEDGSVELNAATIKHAKQNQG